MADTYIVAEIGTSHGGNLDRAAESIAAAADSGADCAKFQYVIADEIIHPATGLVDLPGGAVPLYKRFKSLEREPGFYLELRALCDRHEIDFLCTPFGTRSLDALVKIGVNRIKIASPEINHTGLLQEVQRAELPVILSTGVSRLSDIEYACSFFSGNRVTLLHCVTSYPAPETEYNLSVMSTLFHAFGAPAGLSDHSAHPVLVPGLAAALGAVMIEKHFTLDRKAGGLDDPIALDPAGFAEMCAAVRRIDAIRSLDPANGGSRIVEEFRAEYGADRVAAILGDGVKRLAPSETGNYATTRRSVHVMRDVRAGAFLEAADLAALRSEKNLSPGIDPRYLDEVTGARTNEDIAAGEGLQWRHLLTRRT